MHFWSLLILGMTGVVLGDVVADPEYRSWSGHKVGTVIRVEMAIVDGSGTREVKGFVEKTLVGVKEDAVVLQVRNDSVEAKQAPSIEKQQVISAKADAGEVAFPPTDATEVEVGKETVTVGGKAYEATKTAFTGKRGAGANRYVFWRSAEVPGLFLKEEMYEVGHADVRSVSTLVEVREGAATQPGTRRGGQ